MACGGLGAGVAAAEAIFSQRAAESDGSEQKPLSSGLNRVFEYARTSVTKGTAVSRHKKVLDYLSITLFHIVGKLF